MKDITIGQYYPADSIIHKLDPRVKLLGTVVFLIALFLSNSFITFLLFTVVLASVIKMSKVPFKHLVKGLKGIIMILLISVIFTLFFTPGRVLIHVGVIKITAYGIKKTFYLAIRLIYLVVSTSIMTLTTTPTQLADGLEKAFAVFTKIGMPIHEIAMMMSIALRFIPILMEETEKITMAQKARGAKIDEGNLIARAKSMIPILVPLFMSAIRRAVELADAMEARCYNGGKGRTKMKPLIMKSRDYKGILIIVLFIISVVALNVAANRIEVLRVLIVNA